MNVRGGQRLDWVAAGRFGNDLFAAEDFGASDPRAAEHPRPPAKAQRVAQGRRVFETTADDQATLTGDNDNRRATVDTHREQTRCRTVTDLHFAGVGSPASPPRGMGCWLVLADAAVGRDEHAVATECDAAPAVRHRELRDDRPFHRVHQQDSRAVHDERSRSVRTISNVDLFVWEHQSVVPHDQLRLAESRRERSSEVRRARDVVRSSAKVRAIRLRAEAERHPPSLPRHPLTWSAKPSKFRRHRGRH